MRPRVSRASINPYDMRSNHDDRLGKAKAGSCAGFVLRIEGSVAHPYRRVLGFSHLPPGPRSARWSLATMGTTSFEICYSRVGGRSASRAPA